MRSRWRNRSARKARRRRSGSASTTCAGSPRLMGRLKFRTSYGQNVLNHSLEVAFLAGIMAMRSASTGTSPRAPARHRQAIDRDLQGTLRARPRVPTQARRERAGAAGRRRASHGHRLAVARSDDRQAAMRSRRRAPARGAIFQSAVSGRKAETSPTRSGAYRRPSPSGRPRDPHVVERSRVGRRDRGLSKDIAKRIENELEYPGQIKVTVIRETRAVEFAR